MRYSLRRMQHALRATSLLNRRTVLSAVVVGPLAIILQVALKLRTGVPLVQMVVTIVLAYVVVLVASFLWNWIQAPARLYRDQQRQIAEFEERLYKRRIKGEIHDVTPLHSDEHTPVGSVWPALDNISHAILVAQISICNYDAPTVLKDFQFTLRLNDGRIVIAWFIPEPTQRQFLESFAKRVGVPVGRDIRQMTASNAFGNGDTRTGWLVGVFPGLRGEDVMVARQEVLVHFCDDQGKPHRVEFTVTHAKQRIDPKPGLSAEED